MLIGSSVDAVQSLAEAIVEQAMMDAAGDEIVDGIGRSVRAIHEGSAPATPSADTGDLRDAFRARVAASAVLTPGAKQLVETVEDLDEALRVVMTDKGARPLLRDTYDVRAEQLPTPADGGVGRWRNAPDAVPDAPPAELNTLSFGDVCRSFGVRFDVFDRSLREIDYQSGESRRTVAFTALPEMLADADRADELSDVFDGLLRQNEQILIVLLYAAHDAGRISVSHRFLPRLLLYAIRALGALNCSETAYVEATALLGDPDMIAELPEHERRRLDDLWARTAVRSGRADAVFEQIAQRHVVDPTLETLRLTLELAAVREPRLAVALALAALDGGLSLRPPDRVLIGDVLRVNGDPARAFAVAHRMLVREPLHPEGYPALANAALDLGDEPMWRAAIERYFARQDLAVRHVPARPRPFSFVAADPTHVDAHPLVSIVMTTHNAAATIDDAIASVRAQTATNWELLVVDDASSDDTPAAIARHAERDGRIHPILRTVNAGTYVAKNTALERARGEFVAFHDSDDWMHPMRVLRHLEGMRTGAAGTTSQWIRMDVDGIVMVRRGGTYAHLNPASTFYRRAVLDGLGGFEGVRTGADSELLGRVRATLGSRSVLTLRDCLAIGLHHDASLTRTGPAAFDDHRYSATRVAYWESWVRWHVRCLADGYPLHQATDAPLPFVVPEGLRP